MTTAVPADARTIDLEGVRNLRDLGGQPTRSGGQVRRGVLYRSRTLWFASQADCAVLAALRLDTVVDLRTGPEELRAEDWLCELLDLRYSQLPVHVPPEDAASEHGGMAGLGSGARYQRLLEYNAGSYVRALEIIAEADHHPVLFHGATGVARTGVLAALTLACLEVEPPVIVADCPMDPRAMANFLDLMGGSAGLRRWVLEHGLDESALGRMREALT
jgi:protein-tyrosine phosphatase